MFYAVTALLMAGPVTRFSRAKIALIGATILLTCGLIAAFADNFETLRIARMIAGLGAGMIGAAGTASAASSANPQRVFAIIAVTWGLSAAGGAIIIPYLTVSFGAMGGYLSMVGALVLMVPLLLWLPPPPRDLDLPRETKEALASLSFFQRIAEKLGVRGAPNLKFAVFALLALFIYEIGQGAVQVFLEQFGLRAGLNQIETGKVLGIAGFVGLIGGVFAAWLADRYGNVKPALIGIATNTIVAAALAVGTSATSFAILYLAWNMCFYFVVPYILGIMSEMDKKGRWAVATEAIWWLGAAPGAAVGGYVVNAGGYEGLAVLPIVVGCTSIVIFYFTLSRFYAKKRSA
jgi:predicted MFS family arabinose efflux permease